MFAAIALAVSISVWPSGGLSMSARSAMLVPAPGLFSTMIGWPRLRLHLLRYGAGDDVHGAACGIADDDADRLGRVALPPGSGGGNEAGQT